MRTITIDAHPLNISFESIALCATSLGFLVRPARPIPPIRRPSGGHRMIAETMSVDDDVVEATEAEADELLEAVLLEVDPRFPTRAERCDLSRRQRTQLGDATRLVEHTRAGLDLFLTTNTADFIDGCRRTRLERLCHTEILTPAEFLGRFSRFEVA